MPTDNEILILGTGGNVNRGLAYNSFLLNGSALFEAPPDVMLSLNTLCVDWEAIDRVYISHLHGDHTFGLPFFILNRWIKSLYLRDVL